MIPAFRSLVDPGALAGLLAGAADRRAGGAARPAGRRARRDGRADRQAITAVATARLSGLDLDTGIRHGDVSLDDLHVELDAPRSAAAALPR